MTYRQKERAAALTILILFLGAIGLHYAFSDWGFYSTVPEAEAEARLQLVREAEGWLGICEGDSSHARILQIYNSHQPLAMGYFVQESDSWCAAFVSAAAIEADLTTIIPTECGCQRQIALFQALGCWEESDAAMPQPGDLIYYDWDGPEFGESTGWSDHVGIVVGVKWPFIRVIEGNKDDAVGLRTIPVGHKSIRGYGKPAYTGQ